MGLVQLPKNSVVAGRYRVIRCLRVGGMGAVFEVVDRVTRKRRALKLMPADVLDNEDLARRFQLETTITSKVESEHVVEVFDAGVDEDTGSPFLLMELLMGAELRAVLRRMGRFRASDAVYILHQVALGLERTHEANIVHRDLKPDNVFITRRDDGTLHVKLLDFGIAKLVERATQPERTKVLGTPMYMAPEQLRGDGRVGASADLYALGHVAYALLAGRPYWHPDANETDNVFGLIMRVMKGAREKASERAPEAELPAELDAWFARATAVDEDRRYASAQEQVAALADALGTPSPGSISPSEELMHAFDEAASQVEADFGDVATQTAEPATLGSRRPLRDGYRRWLAMGAVALAASVGTALVLRSERPSAPVPNVPALGAEPQTHGTSTVDEPPAEAPSPSPSPSPSTAIEEAPMPSASTEPPARAAPPTGAPRPQRRAAQPTSQPEPKPEPAIDPLKIR